MRGTWNMLSDVETTDRGIRSFSPDKLNRVEFQWFVVRSLPHQEKKLAALLRQHQPEIPNILEVYCPTRTTVDADGRSKDAHTPLFAGYVFVLSTQQALVSFMHRHYPEGAILYDRRRQPGRKASFLTIPEQQIRFSRISMKTMPSRPSSSSGPIPTMLSTPRPVNPTKSSRFWTVR